MHVDATLGELVCKHVHVCQHFESKFSYRIYLLTRPLSLSLSIQVFASKRNRSSRHAKVGFETLGMSTDTTFHYVLRRLYLDKNRKSSLVSNT